MDNAGSIYITGHSTNLPFQNDIFTAKYDVGGQLAWVDYYNGATSSDDQARRILLAPDGAVYVVGTARNASDDFIIIKYSSSGERLWTAVYDGLVSGSSDWASDAAIDASGNLIVLGGSPHGGSWTAMATIKYNSLGEKQWATHLGDQSTFVRGDVLDCDGNGNVYCAGEIDERDGLGEAFLIVKYDRDGQEVWRSQSEKRVGLKFVHALAVDSRGNVTIVGFDGGNDDFVIIQYDSLGIERWRPQIGGRYSGRGEAYDVIVDEYGYIYATGMIYNTGRGLDFLSVKYDTAGNEVWHDVFHSSSDNDDSAFRLALDQQKNVYIGGTVRNEESNESQFCIIKLDSAGERQWTSFQPGGGYWSSMGFALDNQQNICLAGVAEDSVTGYDATTMKIRPDGEFAWIAHYDKPGNSNDTPVALAFDNSGNAIVLGSSVKGVFDTDLLVVKYGPNGEELWSRQSDPSEGGMDQPKGLAIDASGNIFILGQSQKKGEQDGRIVTLKYSPAGEHEWTATFQGAGTAHGYARDIAVDAHGNALVTGNSRVSFAEDHMVTIKYDHSGNEIWLRNYHPPQPGSVYPQFIELDGDGNAYIGASMYLETSDGIPATLTFKYTRDGKLAWSRPYMGSHGYHVYIKGMALDMKSNVYVCARVLNKPLGYDIDLVKYDNDGNEKWVSSYSSPPSCQPSAIATDVSGSVIITASGFVGDSVGLLILKYGADGIARWQKQIPNTGWAGALAVDGYGNIYLAGDIFEQGENANFLVLGLAPDGELVWRATHNGPQNAEERAYLVAADAHGSVWVSGKSAGRRYSDDTGYITTVKYSRDDGAEQRSFKLSQNYPNPFNAGTAIRYRLEQRSEVELSVFNALGQRVETLVSALQPSGDYEVQWQQPARLASGTYLYRLEIRGTGESSERVVEVRKLVLLK